MGMVLLFLGWVLGILTYDVMYNIIGDDYGYRNRD